VYSDADEAIITDPDDAGEEDIQLMRGLFGSERQSKSLTHFETMYSRVTMILVQRQVFRE